MTAVSKNPNPFQTPAVNTKNHVWWAYVVLILLTGVLIRSYKLGSRRGLDIDEAYDIWVTRQGPVEMLSSLKKDSHPPIYFFLLRSWVDVFGMSETSARSLSAVFGVAALLVVYFIGCRLFSTPIGITAALILSVAPLHVYHSREARMYSMVTLLFLWCFYALWQALERGGRTRWAFLGLSLVVTGYSHNYGLFLFPSCLVCLLLPSYRTRIIPLCTTLAIAILFYLPWFRVVLHQGEVPGIAWIEQFFSELPPAAAVLRSLEVLGAGGKYPVTNRALSHPQAYAGIARCVSVLTYGACLILCFVRPSGTSERKSGPRALGRGKALLAFLLFVPLVVPWVKSMVSTPIYVVGRHDVVVSGFFCLAVALGIHSLPRQARPLIVAVVVLLSAYTLRPYFLNPPKLPSREQADHLMANVKEKDSIVFCTLSGSPIRVHLMRSAFPARMSAFPQETDEHPGWYNPSPDPKRIQEEVEELVIAHWRQQKRIWLVSPVPKNWIDATLLSELEKRFRISQPHSDRSLGIYCFVPVPG
jgi:4-amino-4-deoxy-L-arabinose transferase-like glycosyltransferase